jgi:hypothetical protein
LIWKREANPLPVGFFVIEAGLQQATFTNAFIIMVWWRRLLNIAGL